jgi:hypothetical protein
MKIAMNNKKASYASKTGGAITEKQEKGIGNVVRLSQFTTALRVTYTTKDDNFDIVHHHGEFLKQVQKSANDLQIVPNDSTIQPYNDINMVPTDKDNFNKHFTVLINQSKVEICHRIITSINFNDIKYEKDINNKVNNPLMTYMRKNNIIARIDNFNQKSVVSIGFLINVHPDKVHRDSLHKALERILKGVDLNDKDFDELFLEQMEKKSQHNKRKRDDTTEVDEMNIDSNRTIPQFEIGLGSASYMENNEYHLVKVIDIR